MLELIIVIFSILFFTLFYGFALGLKEDTYKLEELFLNVIPKSLFLSWITVFVSFYLDLASLMLVLLGITVAILFWRKPKVKMEIELYSLISSVVIFGAGFYFLLQDYTFSFLEYDAVVSWNRWAMELFQNEYDPMHSAYPVFFPGLWSLIYKVQGFTDVWILVKLSLFIVPILLLFSCLALMNRNLIVGILISILFVWTFCIQIGDALLSGYMDGPVFGLIQCGIILLILSTDYLESTMDRAMKMLFSAAFVFSIAAITKQAGYLALIFFLIWVSILVIRKKILLKQFVNLAVIAVIPITLFLVIFFLKGRKFLGNLENLQKLSETRTNGEQLEAAYGFLIGTTGVYVFYALLILAIANIFYVKRIKGQLGVFLFVTALIGFYLYQDCCSYSARNGWWVLSFLIGSAICFLLNYNRFHLSRKISFNFKWFYYLLVLVGISITFGSRSSMEQLTAISENEKDTLIPPGMDVVKYMDAMDNKGVFVTKAFPMAFHHKLSGKVAVSFDNYNYVKGINGALSEEDCNPTNDPEFRHRNFKTLSQVLECKPKSLIYIKKIDIPKLKTSNPDYSFEILDSGFNYRLLKPILNQEINTKN